MKKMEHLTRAIKTKPILKAVWGSSAIFAFCTAATFLMRDMPDVSLLSLPCIPALFGLTAAFAIRSDRKVQGSTSR